MDTPTEPGYYWARRRYNDEWRLLVVYIDDYGELRGWYTEIDLTGPAYLPHFYDFHPVHPPASQHGKT